MMRALWVGMLGAVLGLAWCLAVIEHDQARYGYVESTTSTSLHPYW